MAIPATPQNFYAQQGNGQAYLSWDLVAGATSYSLQRSTDGVNYVTVATPSVTNFLDTTVTINTQYYYIVASVNGSGTSTYTAAQVTIPCLQGKISLGELRLRSKQTADLENSNFITLPEWNFYINQSALELYDLLITVYEDYFVAPRLLFTTDGVNNLYALPNGQNYNSAPALYKLYGVDIGLDSSTNAFVTLKKFSFISRNRYVYPQLTANLLGVFNLQYRMIGDNIDFIPVPSGNQPIGLWYFPRLRTMLADSDIMEGISGWSEYVIVDAAIKALQKEESDSTKLEDRKIMLRQRIEESATNRDAGQPECISPTRSWGERWGGAGGDPSGGSWGGY